MPDALANKIAAGEVVQRPASVVKELVENAIDAGAGQVDIVLKGAGSELIGVTDNGCGMSPADALLCFQRHATSKLLAIEDLERIETLGFRGEALASIGAVARVELRTKRIGDPTGTRVRVEGGRWLGQEPCATPEGTSISVRHLFFNVPARRNFLKTPATELRHLIETVQFLALSSPHIGFSLTHDDNEMYRMAPGAGELSGAMLESRIGDLFGEDIRRSLLAVDETTSYLSVRGFVTRPSFHRKTRGEQFLFVNDRFVRNRSLEHAVLSAFEGLLPPGGYPFFTLFLKLNPRHIDVNVHPTKAEVKFDDERGVYGFLNAVIKKTLGSADLAPRLEPDEGPSQMFGREGPSYGNEGRSHPVPRPFEARAAEGMRPAGPDFRTGAAGTLPQGDLTGRLYGPYDTENRHVPSGIRPGPEKEDDTDDTLMWALHNRFILTQIRSGLMVVDQNAAHARILYERALQSLQNGFGLSQQLLFPHTVDLSPADYEVLKDLKPDLKALGFDLDMFSGRTVVIRGVPADIRTGDERLILEEVIEQYKAYRDTLQLTGHENLARSIARRSAVPPGKKLSVKEMRALIDQLFSCRMPYTDPNGRPTIIKIPIEELDRRFGR